MNFQINADTILISVTPSDTIEVLKYLPIADKNALIAATLQKSDEKGFYNPVKLQLYFELHTVYMYTNLEITEEERTDEPALYDALKSNGVIDAIITAIPEEEWAELNTMYYDYLLKKEKSRGSIAGVINSFIENLAPNAENAMKIIEQFDPEKFEQVLKFAQAANGDRPIQ